MARTFLSYEDLRRTGVLSSEATALQYCLDVELLRPNHFCPECQTYMELRSCASTKYSDGYCWSCPGGQHHLSVRARSILYNGNITFINFLHLLWIFVNGTSVAGAARILDMNEKTVRSFYKAIRQCMVEDLLENGATRKIGGRGHIVEIDESKFGKRKYHRGRRVIGKWIVGGYCRTTGECFLVECTDNKRNHHTLLRLIKQHVILTDKWKGYNALRHHGYTHLVVNHSRGFVDPVTGVHTNTCEGMWFHAKRHMLRGHGRTRGVPQVVVPEMCPRCARGVPQVVVPEIVPEMCPRCARDVPEVCPRCAPGGCARDVPQVCFVPEVCPRCAPGVPEIVPQVCPRCASADYRVTRNTYCSVIR